MLLLIEWGRGTVLSPYQSRYCLALYALEGAYRCQTFFVIDASVLGWLDEALGELDWRFDLGGAAFLPFVIFYFWLPRRGFWSPRNNIANLSPLESPSCPSPRVWSEFSEEARTSNLDPVISLGGLLSLISFFLALSDLHARLWTCIQGPYLSPSAIFPAAWGWAVSGGNSPFFSGQLSLRCPYLTQW